MSARQGSGERLRGFVFNPGALPEGQPAGLQAWRERVLRALLGAAVLLGAAAYAINVIPVAQAGQWLLTGIYTLAFAWILAIAVARRLPFKARAYSVLFLFYGLGVVALLAFGLDGDGRLWLLALPVMASLLLGLAGGLWALALSAVTLAAGGALFVTGALAAPLAPLTGPASLATWLSTGVVFLLLALMASVSLAVLTRGLETSLTKERALIAELEHERAELRQRSRDLERRLAQIRSAADISRALSGVLDPEALLRQVVHLIHERAEHYFVAVYLLEADGATLALRAAAGEPAQAEPDAARAQRLPVDETSAVGWAVTRRQSYLGQPEAEPAGPGMAPAEGAARSAVALPLLRRDQVLGALAVRSTQAGAFDRDDIAVLQGIADGLAVALENARLFQELQSSLEEIRALHRQYLAETWAERAGDPGRLSHTFETGAPPETGPEAELRVPLLLRQQPIGHIVLQAGQRPAEQGAGWTPDDLALVEGVAAQAALALENARLLEETQRRARHERLAAEIAIKVRASTDVDTIVRTAISELGRALNASAGSIRVGIEE